jgi:hypothetical protein
MASHASRTKHFHFDFALIAICTHLAGCTYERIPRSTAGLAQSDVRFWHKADMLIAVTNVRFWG